METDQRVLPKPPLLFRALPRRGLSQTMGFLARLWAPIIVWPILVVYSLYYGVIFREMERPLWRYIRFVDFFTRRLKPGLRPQPEDPMAISSPADGKVHHAGTIEKGTLLQVKGFRYDVADLLGSEEDARPFESGTYSVIYLAPGDYHRYHWPFDVHVKRVRHVPGDLWPVNEKALASVPRLFARNERLVLLGETNGKSFAFVPVGALNVGSMRLYFHDVRTNHRKLKDVRQWDVDVNAKRGDECGCFELGSTIVLLLEDGAGALNPLESRTVLRVGEPIGTLD